MEYRDRDNSAIAKDCAICDEPFEIRDMYDKRIICPRCKKFLKTIINLLNWGSYDEKQLVEAELRRRLTEWERSNHEHIDKGCNA